MVVDNSQVLLDLFETILFEEGYEVVCSQTALDNLAEIEQAQPALLVVDCLFNRHYNRWLALEELRQHPRIAGIPTILCTADHLALQQFGGRLHQLGFRVLPKPFNIAELLQVIAQTIHLDSPTPPN
jgi:CheY-like chemotaxis protein